MTTLNGYTFAEEMHIKLESMENLVYMYYINKTACEIAQRIIQLMEEGHKKL